MTQTYASSLPRHSGDDDNTRGSTTATKRRSFFNRCTPAEQWTTFDVLPRDSDTCVSGGAPGALLSAMAPSSPKKCTRYSGFSLSLSRSTATGIQTLADEGPCAQAHRPDSTEPAGQAGVLPSAECFAAHSVSATKGEGIINLSDCWCGNASARGGRPKASHTCPGVAELSSSPRALSSAGNGAIAASELAHVAPPFPASTASPATSNHDSNSTGVLTTSEEDAPRGIHAAAEKHTQSVMGASFDREHAAFEISTEAAAPPKEAMLLEGTTSNVLHGSRKPCRNGIESPTLSQAGEEQAPDSTTSCIWPEESASATASQKVQPDLPATHQVLSPLASAGPRVDVEIGDPEALHENDAHLAHGTSCPALAERAVFLATSGEETETTRKSVTVGSKEWTGRVRRNSDSGIAGPTISTVGDKVDHRESDASGPAPTRTLREDESAGSSQHAYHFPSGSRDITSRKEYPANNPSNPENIGTLTERGQCGSTAEAAIRADTYKSGTPIEERTGRLSDKLRAKFKREFNRSWVDINSAPSWPPIKKTKVLVDASSACPECLLQYLTSDWKIVDLRVGAAQRHEKKKNRLFLNSLCYLFDGVYTQKSTLGRKAGLGLFCERPEGFRKGQIITEFVGWLVDREQAESYRKQRAASHIVAVQKGFLYIDGAKEPTYGMGGGSFANDGSEFLGGPGNNAHFYHWFDDELGRTRVFIRATADIKSGQEIFVPYERTYWLDNFEEQHALQPSEKETSVCLKNSSCSHTQKTNFRIYPPSGQRLRRVSLRASPHSRRRRLLSVGLRMGPCAQAENCPEPFRKKKLEQLRRKFRHREELHKNRLAASGRQHASCCSATSLATRSSGIHASAKQKVQKEDREKSTNHHAVKRPLSAYMLFSKERRRELLLQHYHPAEASQQQQEQMSSRAERGANSITSTSHYTLRRQLEAPKLENQGLKGKSTQASLKLKSRYEVFGEGTRNNASGQQVTRLQSQRMIDSSASISGTAREADERSAPVDATPDHEEGESKETKNNIQNRPVDDSADANGLATADVFPTSLVGAKEELTTGRSRRRSDRFTESTAARSFCVECTAVGNIKNPPLVNEQETSISPAKKRKRSEELHTAGTGKTESVCGTVLKWKEKKQDIGESVPKDVVEWRRRSPRWQQPRRTAQLCAAMIIPNEDTGASVSDDCRADLKEIFARETGTDEVVTATDYQAIHNCDTKQLSVGSTKTDCASTLGNPFSPVLTRRISETSSRSNTASRSYNGERSITIANGIAKAVAPSSAEDTSAAHSFSPGREDIPKSECEKKLRLKRKHNETGTSGDLGATPFSKTPSVYASPMTKRDAILQCFASVIRQVANEWTVMPAQERRKWERLAAKEKERYLRLRQKGSSKKARQRCGAERSLRCKTNKSVCKNFEEKGHRACRRKMKAEPMAQIAAAPKDLLEGIAPQTAVQSAHGAVTAAGTGLDHSLPAPGDEFTTSRERARSRKRARVYDTAIGSGQVVSRLDGYSAKDTQGEEERPAADPSKQTEVNTMGSRRCLTRAAKRAARGAAEQITPERKHRFSQEQRVELPGVKAESLPDSQEIEGHQHLCKSVTVQQVRRGRRRGCMTETAKTGTQEDPEGIIRHGQQLSLYGSVSSVTSCSTTRSSSSRTSSCESRNHRVRNTTHLWQPQDDEVTLPVSSSVTDDVSIAFDSVCEMLKGQQGTVKIEQLRGEQQGPAQLVQDKLIRKQESQRREETLDHAGRRQQQEGERSQQLEMGKTQESCVRNEGVLLRSREVGTRSTKPCLSSPVSAAPLHNASSSTSQDTYGKRTCLTMSVAATGELSSYNARRNLLASPVSGPETVKAHGTIACRRRSGGYNRRDSSNRVD